MVIVWAVALVVFLVIEALTVGITAVWFAAGALAAFICALVSPGTVWLQCAWFVVVSAASLIITRPLVRKYVNGRRQPTNADRVIGHPCKVVETIDNVAGSGAVSVDGKVWTARTVDSSVIPAGEIVMAEAIEGVKLLVRRQEAAATAAKE